jgi:hypothetical protein
MRRKPPYYRWIMVNDGNDSKTTLFYCRFLAPKSPKTTVSFKDNPRDLGFGFRFCCPPEGLFKAGAALAPAAPLDLI